MSIQETGQEAKFQKIGLSPLKESPIDRIADRVAGIISPKPRETKAQQDRAYTVLNFFKTLEDLTPSKKAALVGSTMLPVALFAACQAEVRPATPTPSFPEITPTPVESTRIPTIQPTERPTATLVPPTKTPEPTPTSIFESQLSGKEKFMVALGGGAIGGGEELTPETVRTANQVKIIELATRLNKAVVDGQLPKTTKAENIVFTFGGVKSSGGAETVGAIVVGEGRLWRADSSGVKVWVENGASLYRNCSVMIEENKRFIVQEGKKLFRITGTDATGFVNKMIEVDAAGNPVAGGKEKTSLLINALPDAQTGSNILEIPAKFLPIPEGQQLADAVSGFFNPVTGFVEFKNPEGQNEAVWDPIEGKFIMGSQENIFETIPIPTPEPIQIEGLKVLVENGRVIYKAEAGNKYGLEVGAWAGEYKDNVSVEKEKTGGLVLSSNIVKQLVEENLKTKRLSIPIPIDIRETKDPVLLSYISGYEKLGFVWMVIRVDYNDNLPILSIIPEKTQLDDATSSIYGPAYYDLWREQSPSRNNTVNKGQEMRYLSVTGKGIVFDEGVFKKDASLGDRLGEGKGPIIINVQSLKDKLDLTLEDTLFLEGKPVFLAAN